MPRWWRDGTEWLAELPGRVHSQCQHWGLRLDGPATHGSNAFVVPVVRGGDDFVLRLSPPGDDLAGHVFALEFWDGRGTVRLVDVDFVHGALLLERLDAGHSLRDEPVEEAMVVLGRVIRRLAVPAPEAARSTAEVVAARSVELEVEWSELGEPFARPYLQAALDAAGALAKTSGELAVNADLHSKQVLRGVREEWLVVDPLLLRGDVEYDLARVLWTRLDEMPDDAAIRRCRDAVITAAGLDPSRAAAWIAYRTVDYWLWGLRQGLTEDPARCARLLAAVR